MLKLKLILCAIATQILGGGAVMGNASGPGLTPGNYDGFETGDYRNFLPKYMGDSQDWIRPRFSATSEDAISYDYSVKWEGGQEEHRWLLVSNGFYLARPFRASVQVRVDGPEVSKFSAGLMLLETYEKFSGIHFGPDEVGLHLDAKDWTRPELDAFEFSPGRVYILALALDESGKLDATIFDAESRAPIATLDGITAVTPSALALYVHTPANSEIEIRFDDVTVDAAPYRVRAETWIRASIPHYVALPQKDDVEQAEGHWVGGHTLMKEDGEYSMWYRIRTAEERGQGYGFASSEDGVKWLKYQNNPVFIPDPEKYTSNEKMSVLKVNGTYHGWYAVDVPEGGWFTGYAQSEDGLHWEDEGIILDDQFTKDPDVIYVDGIFYLYAISPSNTDFAVYTSEDGRNWEQRSVIQMGIHRHPTAYYDSESGKFWLYAFGLHLGVHRAWSKDGVNFTDFEPVWHEPAVGIDDWREGGVDYGIFMRNEHGHLVDTRNRILYYQGRNNYGNNHPGWRYHGSERILLAGWFTGLHLDIPTHVAPNRNYEYERFPIGAERIDGVYVQTTSPGRIVVNRWTPGEEVAIDGQLRGSRGTSWRIEITEGLALESTYDLIIAGEVRDTRPSGAFGDTVLRGSLPDSGVQNFRIVRRR